MAPHSALLPIANWNPLLSHCTHTLGTAIFFLLPSFYPRELQIGMFLSQSPCAMLILLVLESVPVASVKPLLFLSPSTPPSPWILAIFLISKISFSSALLDNLLSHFLTTNHLFCQHSVVIKKVCPHNAWTAISVDATGLDSQGWFHFPFPWWQHQQHWPLHLTRHPPWLGGWVSFTPQTSPTLQGHHAPPTILGQF